MRYVSIMGDSISTFEGWNPPGYSVYYTPAIQHRNGLKSVYDTWWAKVNQALGAYLCVNNSYSGSQVAGGRFPCGSADQRVYSLDTGEHVPDVILVYMGVNDFVRGVPVEQKRVLFHRRIEPFTFEGAYEIMLKKMRRRYPQSAIICGTLMRTFIRNRPEWVFPEERHTGLTFDKYNRAIRCAARKSRCKCAQLSTQGLAYETLDGFHPTVNGHMTIASAWVNCLKEMRLITTPT